MRRAERVLQATVAAFEAAFPGRIRSCYVKGSHADQSEVAASDVDALIVFKDAFVSEEERRHAEIVMLRCVEQSEIELDLAIDDERGLERGAWPTLKMGSVLFSGEDIRDQLPLISLEEWTRDRMHSSLWRTVHLCQRAPIIRYPLQYPDPEGEFYGYDRRKLRLANGEEVHCTRDLIRLVGWSATAILAFKAGQYVARKSDCHTLYRRYYADEWADLLEDIYTLCRGRWNYLIPDRPEERRRLREICAHTLGFENHFLQIYREFALALLSADDERGKLQMLEAFQYFFYKDEAIVQALKALRDGSPAIRMNVLLVAKKWNISI